MNFTLNDSAINFELNGQAKPQLLLNSEFNDDSVWTFGMQGFNAWTFVGGAITASLPGVFDATHPIEQNIDGSAAGTYLMLSQWTLSNISGDTAQIRFFFYDEDGNLLWTPGLQPIPLISYYDERSSNGIFELRYEFTTLVPVARISMYVLVWSGSTINISVPFIRLYSPIYHSIFPVNFTLNDEVVNFNLNAPVSILSLGFYRLLETGFYRLLESGGRRLLE